MGILPIIHRLEADATQLLLAWQLLQPVAAPEG
jgi:hypothetical protein